MESLSSMVNRAMGKDIADIWYRKENINPS